MGLISRVSSRTYRCFLFPSACKTTKMPKIRCLSRNIDDYVRDSVNDIQKQHRDYTPESHPFEGQREYVKAVNAAKLTKAFAKPFLYDLDGHNDSVNVLGAHRKRLTTLYSGSFDGVIKEWNLATRSEVRSISAHQGKISGLVTTSHGDKLLSCGDDSLIKYWNNDPLALDQSDTPVHQIASKTLMTNLDAQWRETSDNFFAAGGLDGGVYVYNLEGRSDPVRSYKWGESTVTSIKFNPTEHEMLAACGMDRGVTLYDVRQPKPLRKVTLAMNSNQIAWNPYNPVQFAVASEDYQTYCFDVRKLDHATKILKGHVAAVMSCCYSPTGRQIVTGSYDKTLRVYNLHGNTGSSSTNVYHTKRMQKVFAVHWSADNKYVVSASDEMNIRVWKSNASERLGYLSAAQKSSRNYKEALKRKYANYPEIRRISKHRHLSKHVFTQASTQREMRDKIRRKDRNRKNNIKNYDIKPARQQMVVKEQK